jgi:hypothetical protein
MDGWLAGVELALRAAATEEDVLRALETLREAAAGGGRGAGGASGGGARGVDPHCEATLSQLAALARRVADCGPTGAGCRTGFCVLVAQLFGAAHRRVVSSAAAPSVELLSLMQVRRPRTTL